MSTIARGVPETVLADPPADAQRKLREAMSSPDPRRRDAVAAVVAEFPAYLEAWACLGDLARDEVEAYACYRVGYHRGLDGLRHAGWRGSGYVRWSEPSNRGFLRSLEGLGRVAASIGELDEAERCSVFLRQLDPSLQQGKALSYPGASSGESG